MVVALLWTLVGCGSSPVADKPETDRPASGGAAPWRLFFLHGTLVERQGVYARDPVYGVYGFQALVKAFEARGFEVDAQVRTPARDPQAAAEALAARIRAEVAAGRDPARIALVGFEKGGVIALLTAAELDLPALRTVVLETCGAGRYPESFEWLSEATAGRLRGELLSLYEGSDREAQSCASLAALSPVAFQEHVYRTGAGQGLFFRPRLDWITQVSRWIQRR